MVTVGLPKVMKKNGGGRGHIQGIDGPGHRNVEELVAEGFEIRTETEILRSEEEGG